MKNSETRIKLHHYLSRCLIIIVGSVCMSVMADSGCWWESYSSSREVCHIFQQEEFDRLSIAQQLRLEDEVRHLATLVQNGRVVDVESMIEKRPMLMHIPIKIDDKFRGGVAPLLAREAAKLRSPESRQAFRIILEAGASLIDWDKAGRPYYYGAFLSLHEAIYYKDVDGAEGLKQDLLSISISTPNPLVSGDKKNIQRIKKYSDRAGFLMDVRDDDLVIFIKQEVYPEWFLAFFKNSPKHFHRIIERGFINAKWALPYSYLINLAGNIPLLFWGEQVNLLHFIAGYTLRPGQEYCEPCAISLLDTLSKTEPRFVDALYQLNEENETPVQVALKHNRHKLAEAMGRLRAEKVDEVTPPVSDFLMEPEATQWVEQQIREALPPAENKRVPGASSVHKRHLLKVQLELFRQYNPYQSSALPVALDPVLTRTFDTRHNSGNAPAVHYEDVLPGDFKPGQKIPDNPRGMSLLHQVALLINKPGMGELFNVLMDYLPYDRDDIQDKDGYTPLHYLIMNSAASYLFTYLINSPVKPDHADFLARLATFAQELGESESLTVLKMFDTYSGAGARVHNRAQPIDYWSRRHDSCPSRQLAGRRQGSVEALYQTLATGNDPNQPLKGDTSYTTAVDLDICRFERVSTSEENARDKDHIATLLLFGADIRYLVPIMVSGKREAMERKRERWMRKDPEINTFGLFHDDLINYRIHPSSRSTDWYTSQHNILFSRIRKVASKFELAGGISHAHPVCTCLSLISGDSVFQPHCQQQAKSLREELADKLRFACDKKGYSPLADGMAPFQFYMNE